MHGLVKHAMHVWLVQHAFIVGGIPSKRLSTGLGEVELAGTLPDAIWQSALENMVRNWPTNGTGEDIDYQMLYAEHAVATGNYSVIPLGTASKAMREVLTEVSRLASAAWDNKMRFETNKHGVGVGEYLHASVGHTIPGTMWDAFVHSKEHTTSEAIDRQLFVVELKRGWEALLEPALQCVFSTFSEDCGTDAATVWYGHANLQLLESPRPLPSTLPQLFVVCGDNMTLVLDRPYRDEDDSFAHMEHPPQALTRAALEISTTCDQDVEIRAFAAAWLVKRVRERCEGVAGSTFAVRRFSWLHFRRVHGLDVCRPWCSMDSLAWYRVCCSLVRFTLVAQ